MPCRSIGSAGCDSPDRLLFDATEVKKSGALVKKSPQRRLLQLICTALMKRVRQLAVQLPSCSER